MGYRNWRATVGRDIDLMGFGIVTTCMRIGGIEGGGRRGGRVEVGCGVRRRMRVHVVVAVGFSTASELATFVALVELALCGFCALDTFEAWASTLAGNIDAAAVVLGITILDASERAWTADRFCAVALALCGAT